MNERILIVDDDRDIVELISDILEEEGYEIHKEYNGKGALEKIEENRYDLIILDIMMPGMDGLEVLKKVRDKVESPILFLTAKSKSMDKVIGFEIGADDYITKPFDDYELIARVKAHIRRSKREEKITYTDDGILKFKGIEINKNSYEVFLEGEKIELSTREFQILCYLMENANLVLTREQIYNSIWGYEEYGDINTVTVHIKKLREKVDKDDRYIKTIWGIGYKFVGERE
ncbi:regulatory protein [Fervidicella metallireducens AeB]|uniref:Stage 0 sporulation protein A homolog n=1 Tax=Fervidicella metallireducens AeB TaxID=1403537 RepID=A0A017RVJ7_9CLOT|nr:response regulator transcription factor [Fervidicella metallireducens]EYE87930.1 regulatory protein [Fervidicella metallireducens AeB]